MRTLLILITLFSFSAQAAHKIISINAFDLAYSGGLLYKTDDAKSGPNRKETNFKLNLNYAQEATNIMGLMIKGIFRYERENVDYTSDTTNSTLALSGGFLHNFQYNDIKNSFFGGAQLGIERQSIDNGVKDKSGFNFTLGFEAGKRWDLGTYSVASISYAPSVELLIRRYGGDIRDDYYTRGNEVRLNFLKFDIHF
jgi:hypothetical protein